MADQVTKTFRKEYPLAAHRRQHSVDCPSHVFFDIPRLAKRCGFYPESYWKQRGREIKEDQQPAIVPLRIAWSWGLSYKGQPVLSQVADDCYYVVTEYDAYWSEPQTQEKQKKARKKQQEGEGETGTHQDTLCYPNKRIRHPVSTGVYFSTPKSLIIPDEVKHLENEVRYMMHVVIEQTWNRKHGTGGGRINAQLMAKIIGNKERELFVRKWLCEQRILFTDHTYSPGERAKTYFLNPIYTSYTRWECTKRTLANKVLLNRSRLSGGDTETVDAKIERIVGHGKKPVDEHLDRWLSKLSIDVDACIAAGPENPNLETARAIANRDLATCRCQYGRYHSAVTRLWTPYRQHLSWSGKRAVGLDVKNSQPVIIIKKMREEYWENGLESPHDFREFSRLAEAGTIYDELFSVAKSQFPEYLLERKRRSLQKKQWMLEFRLYVANCAKPKNRHDWASARKRFARARRVKDIEVCTGDISRADFKVMVFADILFGKVEIDNSITQLFAARFPSVADWIQRQKAGSYKNLARLLQREEAQIIIDGICERLRLHHAEVPITPIHDSVLTTEEFLPDVRRVMEEEYARRGLHPSIKVDSGS